MPLLLLTGASGFVGTRLAQRLSEQGTTVRPGTERMGGSPAVDWSGALNGCHGVIHLAARVHVMRESSARPLDAFRAVNTAGTLDLARQAAAAGVRRFVFVSSIKVNGESTAPGHPFNHDDTPHPLDPYGISKREAEDGLRDIAASSGMEVVVVRPPLVYGPGVKANFAAMARAVRRGLPLPLGSVTHNRRSLVALDNLVDLLITCVDHPAAAGQTFLVSDGEDLSTAELLRRLGQAMGRPTRLLPMPPALIEAGAAVLGQRDTARRLLESLQLDITHTRSTLHWAPPLSLDEGLRQAVAGFAP